VLNWQALNWQALSSQVGLPRWWAPVLGVELVAPTVVLLAPM